ncbi:molybdopterin-binding protein [Methyloversatilis sp.]|uniref:competence/damage-inducible protein A n=1 Tax=Methyloversatilis sp. TaxID=2569862 RepID=UPI002735A780|nr:molybdopterin-binding protein [Methyloversatilis sp.]MDP2869466.1 molybdopterin-binding protein [Methyloversatilis sp.]MDP3288552.1 molybdopterin-binding protein [Methyloversatilis sp.]MDP3455260.1 molybdopterin-binding protein [Methyloversatilis sp.]MDP3578454.1 molybdopterin-binding protein [Methyloversatilis sp.]
MAFGLYIIGDEILSGRRQDGHFAKVRALLAERGLQLSWVSYLGDERERLTEAFRRTLATDDIVFSCGGIGITPDDHTRQAAAAALGVECVLHPEAEAQIRARFGAETTENRLRLGEFPAGSHIIPNPFNRIPGFSCSHHHFVPGFPEMAWPMIEWLLDNGYRDLHHTSAWRESSVYVPNAHESRLLDMMEAIEREHGVTVFSLPCFGNAERAYPHIELGAKGEPAKVAAAMAAMRHELMLRGLTVQDVADR